jgi:hypothetical protein
MEKPAGHAPLSKERRMEVFLALVEAQDRRVTVLQSREDVASRFGITKARLARIEQEGLDAGWPPL